MKIFVFAVGLMLVWITKSQALPPPDEIPEEILRTQIITEARSPIDNQLLTAAEYAQLKAQLAKRAFAPQLNSEIRELIFLLELLEMFKTLTPF